MTAKKYIFTVSIIGLLTITSCFAKVAQKNQGIKMAQIKQGEILDLQTFTSAPSGLMFKVLKQGTGTKPYAGETVTVDYTGWLLENGNKIGKKFDSSVDRGEKFQFGLGLGYVIKGWDFTLADMKIGEKRLVIIPANLGYGARGAGNIIPPNATLIFEIDLYAAA